MRPTAVAFLDFSREVLLRSILLLSLLSITLFGSQFVSRLFLFVLLV